ARLQPGPTGLEPACAVPQNSGRPGPMFWLKRALNIVPVMLLISIAAFALVRLAPGGPFDRDRAPASPEIERAMRARYHLDEPVWRQYLRFVGGALKGDLGPSLKYRNHDVSGIIAQGLPVSLTLGALAFLLALGLGVPLGLAGAVRRGGATDTWTSFVAIMAVCVPVFVLGPLLIAVFAVRWGLFPVALWGGPMHLVLPVAALGMFHAGRVARLVREGAGEVPESEFIRAARAKGLPEWVVRARHALPVAILPVVSYSGPMLADLMTGSFVVENLFQLPGIGTLTVNSA